MTLGMCANCYVWSIRNTLSEPHRSAPRKPCRNPSGTCVLPDEKEAKAKELASATLMDVVHQVVISGGNSAGLRGVTPEGYPFIVLIAVAPTPGGAAAVQLLREVEQELCGHDNKNERGEAV